MGEDIVFRIKVKMAQGKLRIPAQIRKLYKIREDEVVEMVGYKDYILIRPTGTTVYALEVFE